MSITHLTPVPHKRTRRDVERDADRNDGVASIDDDAGGRAASASCDIAPTCCATFSSSDPLSPSRISGSVDDEAEGDAVDYSTMLANQQQHWRVAGAFQVALWYVLHYAGHALPAAPLLLARRLLQLYVKCDGATNANQSKEEPKVETGAADSHVSQKLRSGAPALTTGCIELDAIELGLRLALRKPIAFTATRLEQQYGDFLHVQDALDVLEQTHSAWTTYDEGMATRRSVDRDGDDDDDKGGTGNCVSKFCSNTTVQPLLVRWTGRAVAEALLSPPPHHTRLVAVLHAVRATELRLFALSLFQHYGGGAAHLSSTVTSKARGPHALLLPCASIDLPAVPTRKAAIVEYLLQRHYRQTARAPHRGGDNDDDAGGDVAAETSTDATARTEEATLVALCWQAQIGDVYVVQDAVKDGVSLIARLFRVLTDTVDSGCVPRRMNKPHSNSVLHGTDPHAATQLFTRTQFRIQQRATDMTAAKPDAVPPASFLLLAPTPSSSAFFYVRDVTLFASVASWTAYEKALETYQALYTLLNSPAAVVRQSQRHILALYQRAMDALEHDARVGDAERTPQSAVATAKHPCGVKSIATGLSALLRAHGLRVGYLLQFTARYRWYTCVELLYQLLQPLHRYVEANLCLHVLLEEPLLSLCPGTGTSVARFAMYYRVEKRGKWWHRLSQNLVHLRQKDAALGVLEKAHAGWYAASQQPPAVRAAMTELLTLAGTTTGEAEVRARTAAVDHLVRQLPAPLQRQVRLLRALWPEPDRGAAQAARYGTGGGVMVGMAAFHAVMAHLQSGYCRRHDRVNMERTLRALHQQQRRWTPLSAHLGSFTTDLRAAPTLVLTGLRDSEDERLWHDPGRRFAAVASVEGFVLHSLVHGWNAQRDAAPADGTDCARTVARRLFVRDDGVIASERVGLGGAVEADMSGWCGVHSEGRWIALTARVLLAECYYDDHGNAAATGVEDVAEQLLWLSPLQHDPLDIDDPIAFRLRRRQRFEAQLDWLAQATPDALLAHAARHVRGRTTSNGTAAGAETSADTRRLGDESPRRPCEVDVGDFPLLEMLPAVPRRALCALLHCLYASDPLDGYTPTFAGFPDLVLWRTGEGEAGGGGFVLVEVKGPNDTLSAKQIAMNDTLARCGFDVRVALVRDTAPQRPAHPHGTTTIHHCDS